MDTVPILKIIQFIEKKIKKTRPDVIFTHFENDLNVDHQITSKAVVTACRPVKNQTVKSIFFLKFYLVQNGIFQQKIKFLNQTFTLILQNLLNLNLEL